MEKIKKKQQNTKMLNKRTESFFKVIKMLRTKCKYRIGGWDCLWWSAVKGGSKHIKVFNTDLKVVKTGASLLSSESFVAALVHSNLMLLLHLFFFFALWEQSAALYLMTWEAERVRMRQSKEYFGPKKLSNL